MADATLIKEFLVGLGFKTDERSLKNFSNGIANATKEVGKLVTAITGASLAVAAGIAAFASNLEDLYFASKRTNASVLNIKAVQYAAENLGASADEARGSIEALARFMRNNPGGERFLQNLGVKTRDAKGHLLDTTEILINLSKKFQHMPTARANQYAQFLGIPENMMLAMQKGDFEKYIRQYQKQNSGSKADEAAKKAHDLMIQVRELKGEFENLWMGIEKDLLQIANKVLPKLKELLDRVVDLDRSTDGWSTKVFLLGGAFLWLLPKIARVVKAMRELAGIKPPAVAAGAGAGAASAGAAAGAAGAAAKRSWLSRAMPWIGRIGLGLSMMLHSEDLNTGEEDAMNRARARDRQESAMHFFMRMGWSRSQAAGIVANLMRESGFSPSAKGDHGAAYGIAQWHKDRQEAFARWAGHDIHSSTMQEQLAFVQYELTHGSRRKAGALLRAARNARQAGEIVSRRYEAPGLTRDIQDREAALRSAAAVKIEQQTHINVHGVSDPHAAGRAVAKEQSRVNGDMTRNLQGVYQ